MGEVGAFKRIQNSLVLRKIKTKDVQAFLGCSQRSPITGKINLINVDEANDFCLVDLWSRNYIEGTAAQLLCEKHIFRAKVLENRTWFYHQNFESRKNEHDAGEAEPCVRYALEARTMDASGNSGGRWSPMMCTVFMLPTVSFTGSLGLTFLAALVFLGSLAVSIYMNSPNLLKVQRFVTLPFRFAFLIYMLTHINIQYIDEAGEVLKLVTLFMTGFLAMYDIAMGDVSFILSFSQLNKYEIIKELPHRVYVCRLTGPNNLLPKKEFIDKAVTGFKNWDASPDLRLVADVHGLLCELHPLTLEDWEKLVQFTRRTGEELRFAGVNLFNLQRQTLESHLDPDHFVTDPGSLWVQLRDGRLVTNREAKAQNLSEEDFQGMG